ncbi:hypothetical protein E2R60_19860 [Paenibacillus dendritiformis]|uniref:hypothetical protein n=1 Tax=Paenibacillus dendritiformis TaxID=130049 RepID=UPI001059A21E|nr:hypothetical protein [Paenibacillus dendritiformis]TDL51865.1 hypothetical protein E2R60_19860 [Paenibacillus dendritiformis]
MPNQVTIFFCLIIITFISGYWLAVILVPEKLKRYKLLFSFVLGTMWLILINSWVSYMGFTSNASSVYIFISSVLLSLMALFREIRLKCFHQGILYKSNYIILALSFISAGLVLFPIVYFHAFNPYIDGFTYISISDFLLDHSYFEAADPNPYYPWMTQMKLYQEVGYRMGSQFLLAFFTSILNREMSIDVFVPVTALSQFMLIIAVWLFSRIGLKIPVKAAIIAAVFTCFHLSIPLNVAEWGFFPQAYGVMLAVIVFTLFLCISKWEQWGLKKSIVLTSLASASLVVTYSEYVPFAALSILILVIYKAIKHRQLKMGVVKIASVSILTIIISNVAFINAIRAIKHQLGAVVGWHQSYSLWDYILMVLSLNPIYENLFTKFPIIYFIVSLISLIVAYIVSKYFVFIDRWKSQKTDLILIASSFFLMLVIYTFFVYNPWISSQLGHTWNINKIVQYMFLLFPPVIGLSMYSYIKRQKKFISVILGLVYVSITLIFTYYYSMVNTEQMRIYTGDTDYPINQYYKLKQAYENKEGPINIVISSDLIKHRQMIAYFLKEKKLVSDWSNDDYISYMMSEEYRNKNFEKNGITLLFNNNAETKIANMELVDDKVALFFTSGVFGLERNAENSWQWSSGSADLQLINNSEDRKPITLKFSVRLPPGVSETNVLTVLYEGKTIAEKPINYSGINDVNIQLDTFPGLSNLQLVYSGSAVTLPDDPRSLAFSIVDLVVEQ